MTTLETALAYAKLGLRVIPIAPGEKYPKGIESWQTVATTDPATITEWYTNRYKDWGVGVVTGLTESGRQIFVLDVDDREEYCGSDTLAELEKANQPLPETVEAITGTGGRHLYFFAPNEIRNDAGSRLGIGLDIRGAGGQVLASPTTHPNGRQYQWVDGQSPSDRRPADAPQWLLTLLTTQPVIDKPQHTSDPILDDPNTPSAKYCSQTTWGQLLIPDGWTHTKTDRNGEQHWTRPNKDSRDGISATIGHNGNDALIVFTSTIPWLPIGGYNRFGYMAARDHAGDWKQAAKQFMKTPTPPTHTTATPTEQWPTPIPLTTTHTLPPFPTHTLPNWIADHVNQVAEETQTPVDLAATLALSALSTITNKYATTHVYNTWHENTNLYLVIALPPGAGKSPVFKLMLQPVNDHEMFLQEQHAEKIGDLLQRERMTTIEMTRAEKAGDKQAARELREHLELHPIPPTPTLIADDATPEAITLLLAEQNGRLAIHSTEGGLFEMMTGKYSDQSNLDVYLKAFTGDDITVHRIGRQQKPIKKASISIGITTQPSVLQELAKHPELKGRGLTARFMYSLPANNVGYRNYKTIASHNPRTANTYNEHMQQIISQHQTPQQHTLHPSTLNLFLQHRTNIELRRQPDKDLAHMAEWTQKLDTVTIRTATLLHTANHLTGPIMPETLNNAIEIAGYWIEHSKAVHDLWGSDDLTNQANQILDWIKRNGTTQFTLRDIHAHNRRLFPTAQDTIQPIELLIERSWIRPMFDGPILTGQRGKSAQHFEANPSIV